ncbi:MAG: hypothetical protein QOE66_1974 [Chloroflexota bacterium]|nr:hypothetical protein [Chloroflexota bacterium]
MKPWGREGPTGPRADALGDLAEAGIELDPPTPADRARRATGEPDEPHVHDDARPHAHPHVHSRPEEPPIIGIVGAGAVGTALGVALSRAGWPIQAVASRDVGRRERFRSLVPGVRAFAEATAILDEVELVIVAVPDDVIPSMAGRLHLYGGQAIVHTSGLLGAEALSAAMAAGTQIGAFHPLVAFADTERAVAALRGATIAIEGDPQLLDLLARMAEAVGGRPVRLPPGAKAAYHAAAMLAAGGLVALLDAIAELGRVAGLDEPAALAVYGPLLEQTLANAEAIGIANALTGPMTRGDAGTVKAHLAELRRHAPGVVELYEALARRELALAEARGTLAPEGVDRVRNSLANPA